MKGVQQWLMDVLNGAKPVPLLARILLAVVLLRVADGQLPADLLAAVLAGAGLPSKP